MSTFLTVLLLIIIGSITLGLFIVFTAVVCLEIMSTYHNFLQKEVKDDARHEK